MSKKGDAWMPLDIGSYLGDTGRLTTEGHGAYLLLLMDYWRNGPPPADDETLAAITRLPLTRWRKLRPAIAQFFTIQDGRWHQKRADEERAKRDRIVAERTKAGKAGAAKRHGKTVANATANDQQTGQQNDAPLPFTITSEECSVANATDAAASPAGTVLDLKRELWDRARAMLCKRGIGRQQAGSLIGKWLKNLGPPDSETRLLHILAHAEAHCEGNIVEYVEGSIRRSGNVQRTQQGGYTGTAAAIAGISAAAGE